MGVGCKDMTVLLLSAELCSHTLLSFPVRYPSKPPALCPCSPWNSPAVSVALVAFVALVSIAIGIRKAYTSITLQIVQERVSHALTRCNYLPGLICISYRW